MKAVYLICWKKSVPLAFKLVKERRLCITDEEKQNLQAELATYKDLSLDVVSIDEYSISKSEEATKVYRLATKKVSN